MEQTDWQKGILEWIQQLERTVQRINERTKNHTLEIKELKKKVGEKDR